MALPSAINLMVPDLSREVSVRNFHRRLVLVHPAGIALSGERSEGRVGRGGLSSVAAREGRGGARAVGGSGLAGKRAPER